MPERMGGLLDAVLRGIDDTVPVAERIDRSAALKALIDDYQGHARNDATLPTINSLTTGAELKWAIALLDPSIQLAMLKKYSDTVLGKVVTGVESPELVEQRKLRHWLAKFMAVVAMSMILIMFLAVVSVIYKSDKLPEGSIFSSIMTTAVEILKLVFSSGLK